MACAARLIDVRLRSYSLTHFNALLFPPYLLGNLTILIYQDLCALLSYHFNLHVHFLREAVDLPILEAPICDLLAIMLPPFAVLGLVR